MGLGFVVIINYTNVQASLNQGGKWKPSLVFQTTLISVSARELSCTEILLISSSIERLQITAPAITAF
jgi:hypothetical protein